MRNCCETKQNEPHGYNCSYWIYFPPEGVPGLNAPPYKDCAFCGCPLAEDEEQRGVCNKCGY